MKDFNLKSRYWMAFAGMTLLVMPVWSAPAKKATPAKSTKAAPSKAAQAAPPEAPAPAAAKQVKEGEFEATSTGINKQRMTVGKIDPPAAFNLEDIQNFPEERLHPVLNNPLTFEEGRDFSNLMDSQDAQLVHPWLPEIVSAPYLNMKPVLEKAAKDWTFSVIDQGGTPVYKTTGKGSPPDLFAWNGEDSKRGRVAVDTVYIPQLSTTDKEGYRHTLMGHPSQFASIIVDDKGRQIIEMSSKRIFVDKKADFSKEAPLFLDKAADRIREDARLPFAVQAFDADPELAQARTDAVIKYLIGRLYIPASQIKALPPGSNEKRGLSIALTLNGTPGGAE